MDASELRLEWLGKPAIPPFESPKEVLVVREGTRGPTDLFGRFAFICVHSRPFFFFEVREIGR